MKVMALTAFLLHNTPHLAWLHLYYITVIVFSDNHYTKWTLNPLAFSELLHVDCVCRRLFWGHVLRICSFCKSDLCRVYGS